MSESIAVRFQVTALRVGITTTFHDCVIHVAFPRQEDPAKIKSHLNTLIGHLPPTILDGLRELEVMRETADLDGELALLFEPPACETPDIEQDQA